MSPRRHALATRKGAVLGALLLAATTALSRLVGRSRARRRGARARGHAVQRPHADPDRRAGDHLDRHGGQRRDRDQGRRAGRHRRRRRLHLCHRAGARAVVNAGPGDDFVGARAHKGKTFVSLGFGDDVFFGGSGDDRVWSQEASNQSSPDDQDRIETGAGDDYVISGSSAAPNTDVVSLGPGDDALVTYGFAAGATLLGGHGTNTYQPLPGPDVSGDWTFDNVTGQATLDSVTQAGVDVVPAVRPQGSARLDVALPRQQGQRVGRDGRHLPRGPARPRRRRPPHRRRRGLQQPARPATLCWSAARVTTSSTGRTATTSCAAEGAATGRTAEHGTDLCTAEDPDRASPLRGVRCARHEPRRGATWTQPHAARRRSDRGSGGRG